MWKYRWLQLQQDASIYFYVFNKSMHTNKNKKPLNKAAMCWCMLGVRENVFLWVDELKLIFGTNVDDVILNI